MKHMPWYHIMDRSHDRRYAATMTENGRVVVPARLRKLLGVEGTRTELFFHVRDGEVTLITKMQALRRAQARLDAMAPTGTRLASEELIEDREAAARLESSDAQDRT